MAESISYHRRSPRDRRLRVGDAEREAAGEILRRQHVDGRIDRDEFQERLERSLSAKTYADLDALLADLPVQARERRPASWRPWPPFVFVPLLVAVIVASHGHLAWLVVPFLFFFVVRPFFLARRS
jgi:Domain of unknown function (DUF1707)